MTWATFTPCFLWLFLGAPQIEKLQGNKNLTSALSTLTAAIVGVILNLVFWFCGSRIFFWRPAPLTGSPSHSAP
ncbi:MAG: chromate transporter [Verrucomicrobiota bacterium]|nr:chromate transporter [Verrucomicrobiota bacterium]